MQGRAEGVSERSEPASPQKRYREVSRHSSSLEEPSGASGSSKTVSSGSSDEYQPTTKRTRANHARTTRASARLRATATVKEESPETSTPESMDSLRESGGSNASKADQGNEEDGDGDGNDEPEDADGDEEKPKPKRRKYVRRDQARRKEQNAQAQKKFRQKKKKLAEQVRYPAKRDWQPADSAQMKTDLDEALERSKVLAEKLEQANEQIAAMGVEIQQLRLGMMKCKCVGPDT